MSMRLLKLGAQITFDGRTYEIVGRTPMSVEPKRVFLRDLETGKQLAVEEIAIHEATA